jgi:ribosomal protein S18 acetylase RimI-like enzyme
MTAMTVSIRRAKPNDHATLVEYNRRMAWETEQKRLDDDALSQGVAAALADPAKGFYLVAEGNGEIVGQLMITSEWSDWRNGFFWWIQSVYVREDARRQGVFRCLYREVERLANETGDIVGIRLYVERDNVRAQKTYEELGMTEEAYCIYVHEPLQGEKKICEESIREAHE